MTCIPSGKQVLAATEEDVKRMLSTKVHLGTKNLTNQMEKYIFGRRKDGIHIIDLHSTWQKLILAARVIVTIENPQDVCAISARQYGQRAVMKFAHYTNANCIAGRFTPGNFTNQVQERFLQPRILIVTDPRTDHQAIKESAYANIPVIAFCDTDAPLDYVDIAIPCNNRGRQAIGMMYWLLAREVLRMRGSISRLTPWSEKVDLFFYRDPEEVLKKPEEAAAEEQQLTSTYAADAKATFEKTIEGGAGDSWGDETGTWETPGNWGIE